MTRDNGGDDNAKAPIARVLERHADKVEKILEVVEDGHDARDMIGATQDTIAVSMGLARTLREATGLARTVGLHSSPMRGVDAATRKAKREAQIAESRERRKRAREAAAERKRKAAERAVKREAFKARRAAEKARARGES